MRYFFAVEYRARLRCLDLLLSAHEYYFLEASSLAPFRGTCFGGCECCTLCACIWIAALSFYRYCECVLLALLDCCVGERFYSKRNFLALRKVRVFLA